jgi:carbonic anhydrase/acetyltransferase-like protein (isoleucine patch superfamily)
MPIYGLEDGWEPQIHPEAFIHPQAVLIGKVIVGAESSVWPGTVIRADDNEIIIGERTSVQDGAVLHCTHEWKTIVGDDCTIGHNAHLEGCTLENGSLAGSGSVILHGAIVSSGALVGANALLPGGKVVPPNAMALGVPAKFREDANSLELNLLNSANYVERAKRYRAHMRRLDTQGQTDQ